jgi:ribose/xylose/arabinose/galactoside ABC-type transport system permease subunit
LQFKELRRTRVGNIVTVFVLIQTGCILFSLIFPERFRYTDVANIQVVLKAIPQLATIAMGVNLLMIAGEFDLSVGSNFTFSAFVMALTFNRGVSPSVSAILALLVGCFIGYLNGVIVTKTRIPSFIATLGSMMFWRGMIYLVSGGRPASFKPGGTFQTVFTASIGPLQAQFFWLLLVAILCYLLLEHHRLGNHFFAVGGNRQAAMAVGIDVNRVKLVAFVIAGVTAAFSGIMSTTRVSAVSPIQGEGLELQAIAACVIGGTSLSGGEGTVLGAFLGAALLYTIQDILLLLRAPGFYLNMFVGIVILIAAIINQLLFSKGGR